MRALHCGYTLLARGTKLGVIGGYCGGVHHKLRSLYVFSPVPHINLYAEVFDSCKRVAFVIIRPGKEVPLTVQYFGKRAHSAAAYAYHMNMLYLCYDLILITKLLHNRSP